MRHTAHLRPASGIIADMDDGWPPQLDGLALDERLVRALALAVSALAEAVNSEMSGYVALNTLENVAHELDFMNADQRREFRALCERIAAGASPPLPADWLRALPDSLGLR
jgi:hypothetical protein